VAASRGPLLATRRDLGPTLVIHGEEDIIIPIAAGEEMAGGVQNGRFVRVANAGHTPNLEDPDAVNAAISDFVESLVLAP
jgi:pimeloyl-ACP methyl ester carboxylesterase